MTTDVRIIYTEGGSDAFNVVKGQFEAPGGGTLYVRWAPLGRLGASNYSTGAGFVKTFQYPPIDAEVLGLNARNHALDHAEGDWIAPLDDDDEWTDDHVEVLLRTARAADADFAYGQSEYHWPDGHYQLAGRWPPGMGSFCDGAQIYRNGMGYRYDPGCIGRGLPEDGDMWERMVKGGVKFTFLPQVVHHYYPNPR